MSSERDISVKLIGHTVILVFNHIMNLIILFGEADICNSIYWRYVKIMTMSDEVKNINEQLKVVHEKAYAEVESNFADLVEVLGQLDPVKLICQLTLTFLTVPEGEFIDESSEIHHWARWVEFIMGYLLTRDYPQNAKKEIDGDDLNNIEDKLEKYFSSVSLAMLSDKPRIGENNEIDLVVNRAKSNSLYLRGETYPSQLRSVARDIYSQHDDWFIRNLGFTIRDAQDISRAIVNEYNRRLNDEKEACKQRARKEAEELLKEGKINEEAFDKVETSIGCYYYFGNSDGILSFTLEDLAHFSGFSKEHCECYLRRLSQGFGYRNSNYPATFTNSHSSPWDYNTLYERPIICHENQYFVPLTSLFDEVLLHTFYYDLIDDNGYWKREGERKYGACLEQKTAEFLRRIFPSAEVFTNPMYLNRNELCDVLVLHDRNIFIVQCKTKRLRYESKIGESLELIRDDLQKAVKNSFIQATKARDFFKQNQPAKILVQNGSINIDSSQISDMFLLSVTLGSYPHLVTRIANINPALNLFSDDQYPWAISLFDLGIITDLIDSPAVFIHYARHRIAIERTKFDILADELDLLGFYFSQGLYLKLEEFEKASTLSLSGLSTDIDRYNFEKYECGRDAFPKPEQLMPTKFKELIEAIEGLVSPYKTDCVVRLLELDHKGRQTFINAAEKIKQQTLDDNILHSVSTTLEGIGLGLSFITMNSGGDTEELYRQVFSFAVTKKYVTKCKEWVGLGWDSSQEHIVDVALFLSFEWHEDPVIAQIAHGNLKPGELFDGGE